MRHPIVPFLALAAVCACASPGLEPGAPVPATTFAEQVDHGRALYGQHCAKCHGANGEGDEGPRLVGLKQGALPLDPPASRKVRKSRFVTVADVAEFVVTSMPPKKGGLLSGDQYLAILAFDLSANGIDLGRPPLTMAKARELTIPR